MISQWSVKNFKSISQEVTVDLGPLTLFVGQNSAGKSTLIQSILMMAQTLQSTVHSRSVILNGRILRLGAFSDIRSNGSDLDTVTIGFELKRPVFQTPTKAPTTTPNYYYVLPHEEKLRAIEGSLTFSAGIGGENDLSLQLQPRLESGSIKYRSTDNDLDFNFDFKRSDESVDSTLARLRVHAENTRISDFSALNFQINSTNPIKHYRRHYRLPGTVQPAGVTFKHFLPVSVGAAYDAVEVEVNTVFDVLAGTAFRHIYGASTANFSNYASKELANLYAQTCKDAAAVLSPLAHNRVIEAANALIDDFTVARVEFVHAALLSHGKKQLAILLNEREGDIRAVIRNGRPPRREISMFPVTEPIMYATDYINSFFSEKLKYLGPLRDEPKAVYSLAGHNDPKDVGYRGEYTAAVLDNNRSVDVEYVPSSEFPIGEQKTVSLANGHLVVAVRDWLEYLGIASKVVTEDKGKLGHEMKISTGVSDAFHDLTHVGVGVSQALPILVLSLLAETGSTLIFEQPELHLHPKVQTRLADFFMSQVFAGKQCIVETHSEYLVSRLRYLSAMAENVEVSKLIKIFFVEKPAEQSIYKNVEISATGVIKNWPTGFFDEADRNSAAIIKAQIAKAKKSKLKRSGSVE